MFKEDKENKASMEDTSNENLLPEDNATEENEQLEVDGGTPSLPVTEKEDDEKLELDDGEASLPVTNLEEESLETDLPPELDSSDNEEVKAENEKLDIPKKEDTRTEQEKIEDALEEAALELELQKDERSSLSSIRKAAAKTAKELDEKAEKEAMLEAQNKQRTGGGGGFSFPSIFKRDKKVNLNPGQILNNQAIKLNKNYLGLVRSEQEVLRHKKEFNDAIALERNRIPGFDTRMKTLEAFKVENKLLNNVDAIDAMKKSSDPRVKNVVKELNNDIKNSKYLSSAYTDMKKSLSNYEINSNSVAKGAEKLMKNGVDMFEEDQLKTIYDNAMQRNQKLQKEMADQQLKSKNDKSFQDKLKEIGNNFSNLFNSLIDAVKKMAGFGGMKR